MNTTFIRSAKLCSDNARRLLEEAELLEYKQPPATRYYLSMIAQEEFAKAFLLYLIAVDAMPWTPFVLRATRDHHCKQLLGIILDHISPDTDEFLRRMECWRTAEDQSILPPAVADAMNILCHEKIRRWESKSWVWAEDPEYDKTAMHVAEGKRDKEKQLGLYVELGKSGEVFATPTLVTQAQANDEYERGRRFESCVLGLAAGQPCGALDYERVERCFKALFSRPNAFLESESS